MDQLIGENYFLRGWLEFVLVNVFGRPYNQSPDSPETDGRHKRLSNALYRKGILRANPERPEESRNTAEFGVEHLRRSQCSQGSVVTRLSVHG